ncbi:Hint domain-containing protein [Chelatococcus reniformis]|uniref:Hedgehog/Intein (Hint) domain-containing protein n=1 Tax=Chelatococcus reniformis TaxID=1494448 RepID=A0A916XQD5_9HYPH|nr:Hint domain-containing protein [Chelatococcus reniformis]GGC92055.1 hypothetical protein GCM10010994_57310 [Chelatococcus reniformis]
MPIYTDPTSGVSYNVSDPVLGLVNVTVVRPGFADQTFNAVPAGNVLQTDGGTLNILSILNSQFFVPPTIDGTVTTVIALASTTNIHVGGSAVISTGATALSNTIITADGGDVTFAPGVLATALSGSTINLNNGGSFTGGFNLLNLITGTTINFQSGGGTFVADAGGGLLDISGLTINSFDATTDKIQFNDLASPLASYDIVQNGGSQTITGYDSEGNEILSFAVAGTTFATGTGFTAGTGPLNITDDGNLIIAACFLAGTHVATPDGAVAIEELKAGDLVMTSDGAAKPVRWLARQTVSRRFADPAKSLPVRIQAGALGANLPERDLYVSPDHALLIDGCLVQAGALLNGTTIAQFGQAPQTFVYYHVELDDHSLVMVEGVAAETFVDNVSRRAFDNWQEAPEAPVAEMLLPRAKAWRQLPQATRERLAARTVALSAGTQRAA